MRERIARLIRNRKRWAVVGVTITGEQVEQDGRPRYWTRAAAHFQCYMLLMQDETRKGMENWTEVKVTPISAPVLARMSELSK